MTVKRKTSSAADSSTVRTRSSGTSAPAARKQAARKATAKTSKTAAKSRPGVAAAAKPARKSATVVAHQPKPKPALPPAVVNVIEFALGEMKAANVKVLDVHELTDIADTLVIASGTSDRHVRAIADRVVEEAKKSGFKPMGVEGERDGEWVLVDLQDVIVHIMLPRVREFYRLESLWDVSAARREAAQSA